MAFVAFGDRAFSLRCDRCRSWAPAVIWHVPIDSQTLFEGQLEAIECARDRGFDLTFRMGPGRSVTIVRCLCPACARLLVN